VFEMVEVMGVTARPTCPFLVRVANSKPRWKRLFQL
jgi:hypothetical protein